MSRFVIVDLETTGNSAKNGDEIIEIGIVVIENYTIVDEYDAQIKPNGAIPPFVSQLTGIQKKDLKDAPTFDQIIPEIRPYFDDSFFVAHPVHFDYEFLNQSLAKWGYSPIACPVIDTVELSRVFFPSASGYRLQNLAGYLNIEHYKPHRALSDAYVTALLFLEIIKKIKQLPIETLDQLKPLLSSLQTDTEFFYDDMVEKQRNQLLNGSRFTYEYGLAIKPSTAEDPHKTVVSENSFDEFFDQSLSGSFFEERIGQKEIAQEIYESLSSERHHIIEAGPGLGKTLAYLLASYQYSKQHDKRVIISTYTLQLQKQIFAYGERFPAIFPAGSLALLKSPQNYIHLRRFKAFYDRYKKEVGNFDITLSLAIILVWLTETTTGDVEELQLPSRGQDVWRMIACDHDDDTTDLASYFDLAKEKAAKSSIVIVNHAFLIADMKRGRKGIPASRQIIIDEAHHLEQVARQQLSTKIDYLMTVQLFQSLSRIENHQILEDSKMNADQFFRSIYQAVEFLHSPKDPVSDTGKIQLSIDQETLQMIFSGEIREQLNEFLLSCENLSKSVLKNSLTSDLERSIQVIASRQLEDINSFLRAFFRVEEPGVRWIEIDQHGAKNAASLFLEPIEVSERLSSWYDHYTKSILFMSSTLQTKDSFQHFMKAIGLEKDTTSSIYPAPFSYTGQSEILVPSDFPNVTDLSAKRYANHVASFVKGLYEQTNKKILVLFTSYQMLKDTYEQIKSETDSMTILAQGVQSSSRDKLKHLFENTDDVILLGTSSFWEGMDILNEPEKIICMARLPFESPTHPVFQAKWELLKQQNENAFQKLALPNAILKFRQAFGRLIRHTDDRGLFIILDKRVMSKAYGKKFIQALPETLLHYEDTEQIYSHAKKWFS